MDRARVCLLGIGSPAHTSRIIRLLMSESVDLSVQTLQFHLFMPNLADRLLVANLGDRWLPFSVELRRKVINSSLTL